MGDTAHSYHSWASRPTSSSSFSYTASFTLSIPPERDVLSAPQPPPPTSPSALTATYLTPPPCYTPLPPTSHLPVSFLPSLFLSRGPYFVRRPFFVSCLRIGVALRVLHGVVARPLRRRHRCPHPHACLRDADYVLPLRSLAPLEPRARGGGKGKGVGRGRRRCAFAVSASLLFARGLRHPLTPVYSLLISWHFGHQTFNFKGRAAGCDSRRWWLFRAGR